MRLRNTDIAALAPLAPPRQAVLPLDRVRDWYLAPIRSGRRDPEGDLLDDRTRPLVFYSLDDASAVLRLTRTPLREIRTSF